MRLPKRCVVPSVLLFGLLNGLCLPPPAVCVDEPARLKTDHYPPSKQTWRERACLKNAAESEFLGGWFYLAREKQESLVEYLRKHFGQNHWTMLEDERTLKQLQRICELSNNKRTDTPLYCDVLRSIALGHRDKGNDAKAYVVFSQYLNGIRSLYGAEHPDVIRATSDLADASPDFWNSKESLTDSFEKAREFAERNPNDPTRLALLLACSRNLASFYDILCESA